MSVNLLVLGADGFLGRHLVHEARRSRGVQRVHTGIRWRDSPSPKAFGVAVEQTLSLIGPAIVVNAIGGPHGPDLSAINLTPLRMIIDALDRRGRVDSLVHIGSAAEYGDISSPMSEADRCDPNSHYGLVKLRATQSALAMGTAVVVLRPFSVVGAGMPEHTLLGRLSRAILRGDPTFDADSLSAIRDFVGARDVARAILRAADALSRDTAVGGQVVNVGSGKGMVVRDMVDLVLLQARSRVKVLERPAETRASNAVAEASKARDLLGWTPRIGTVTMAATVVGKTTVSRET